MSIVAEPYKEIKGLFPEGKIILHDGRILDCYPLAAQAPDKIDEDHLELDTTGQFLSVGAKKPQPVSPKSKDTEEQKELRCLDDVFHKRMVITHRKDLCQGDYLIDDRGKNGTSEFSGEWIEFGSDRFPNWLSVFDYLIPSDN